MLARVLAPVAIRPPYCGMTLFVVVLVTGVHFGVFSSMLRPSSLMPHVVMQDSNVVSALVIAHTSPPQQVMAPQPLSQDALLFSERSQLEMPRPEPEHVPVSTPDIAYETTFETEPALVPVPQQSPPTPVSMEQVVEQKDMFNTPAANSNAVIAPRADAAHLNNPLPQYPGQSRRRLEEGTVLLDVLILADGSVGELRLKESSGFNRLDKSALAAVEKWRYQPATQGGEAIDFWYVQPVSFALR